ncbi:unnamed protein product [Bursaphelenchus xylophilus]|uniref:(pine wood nematode) hypothetical protein n=1 Tax=Bursaphelenchus xylophilus TaxID=6326 RepID=A0A7I8WYF9_BURXY|nr:unnamed protein product [Bursaphelenchus xylophilus]CAG9101095.1 unnamed protein product [Bursaphelenchus xylophilus]
MPEAIFCYSGVKQAENWTEPFRPRECAEEFTWCIVSKNHNLTGNADVTLYGCATHDDCQLAIKEFPSKQNEGPKAPRRRNNKGMGFFTSHGTKAAADTCCQTDLCNSSWRLRSNACQDAWVHFSSRQNF